MTAGPLCDDGEPSGPRAAGLPRLSSRLPAALCGFHSVAFFLSSLGQAIPKYFIIFHAAEMELITAPNHPQQMPWELAGVQMLRTYSVGKKRNRMELTSNFLPSFSAVGE